MFAAQALALDAETLIIVHCNTGDPGAPIEMQERPMSLAAPRTDTQTDLITLMEAARSAADALLHDATIKVRERLSRNGRIDASLLDREQRAAHGLAWFATY